MRYLLFLLVVAAWAQPTRPPAPSRPNIRFGGGSFAVGDCAQFNAFGDLVSNGSSCGGNGETNTASNVGAAGIGTYNAKSGVDLQFRKLDTASNRLTIVLDGSGTKINFDVVPGNILLSGLGGFLGLSQLNTTGTPDNTRFLRGDGVWAVPAGTISSIALGVPSFLTPSGTPCTTGACSLSFSFNPQTGRKFLASPADGSSGAPDMRAIVAADVPALSALTGSLGIAQINASGTASASTYLRGDGSWAPAGGGSIADFAPSRSTTVITIAGGVCGFSGASVGASTATISAGSGSGLFEVYVSSSCVPVVAHQTAAGLTVVCAGGCQQVQMAVPSTPSDGKQVATGVITSGTWSSITDRRSFFTWTPMSAGTGISLTYPASVATVAINSSVARRDVANTWLGANDFAGGSATMPIGGPLGGHSETIPVSNVYFSGGASSVGYLLTPGASLPNAGGTAEFGLIVPTGATSISAPTITFRWIAEDDQTNAASVTVSVGCWPTGNTVSATYGTGVATTLTPASGGYRRSQAPVSVTTATTAAPCPPGALFAVRFVRNAADANTNGIGIGIGGIEVVW
jgi:hypothetical protein